MSTTRAQLLPYIATVIDTALSADHTVADGPYETEQAAIDAAQEED